MKRTVAVFTLLMVLVFALQTGLCADLGGLLSGGTVALTIQLKDVAPDWWRMSIGGASSGGMEAFYSAIMGRGAGGATGYYTKGDSVTLAGETYLICYEVQKKPIDYMKLMESGGKPPKAEPLTPETKLALALLNLRTVTTISEIRPFNLEQEIAGSEGATKEEATTESLNNLKQLALALLMCANDYDEVLPQLTDAAAVKKTLLPYVKSESLFINPVTKQPYLPNPILSGKKLAHITNPRAMVLFFEDSPAPDGTRGVAFLDGHAKRVPEAEWEALKKASKIP